MYRARCWIPIHLVLALWLAGCAAREPSHLLDGPKTSARLRAEPWEYEGKSAHKVRSEHYVLLTTINDAQVVGAVGQVMEGAFGQYRKIAPDALLTKQPMECYLFDERDQWRRFTERQTGSDAKIYLQIRRGGYTVGDRYVAFFLGELQTYSVAAHEGWHQYVARHFKHRPPPFLEEGLACLFEQVKWEGNLPRWDLTANSNRVDGLRRAVLNRSLLSLSKLISMHAGQVVNQSASNVETFYAQSWGFARFLWDADDGKYRPALQHLLADAAAGNLYRDGIARNPGSTEWDPKSAGPILERYLQMPLANIEHAYRAYVRKITVGAQPRGFGL